jgi:hypothetical protein
MHKLDALAAQWHVSKSEALRRAIDLTARDQAVGAPPWLQAFQKLQKSLNARLTRRQIERWAIETQRERVRSSARREWR